MLSHQEIFTLHLRHPFGIARGVAREARTVLFQLGGAGQAEAPPVSYLKQTCEQAVEILARLAQGVTEDNLDDLGHHEERARSIAPEHSSARCAIDLALWDARGRRRGRPVRELIGAPMPRVPTTYTVSLADPADMEARAREAAHLPLLKVKLGRGREPDLEAIRRVRAAAPNAVLRVDANAGWTLETALALAPRLADLGVEFIEQPLAIGNLEQLARLRRLSPLPIIADEDAQDMRSLPALRGCVDGINIKLSKCGGITEALRMISHARREGWQVMLGCMLETRLGLSAAAQLAGLVDCLDLDAHMLTANDPFPPGSLAHPDPTVPLPGGPGLGLPLWEPSQSRANEGADPR